MMYERPSDVSVIYPISPAIERVKTILFRPFDLAKWFTIGFCAFLANLGSNGGGNGGGGGNPGARRGGSGGGPEEFKQAMYNGKEYFLDNAGWIVPVAIGVSLLIITIMIVFTWLSSRGRFMFLHCVALNKAEVVIPWSQYRQHAYSLFLFRIVLGFIGFVIIVPPIVLTAILVAPFIINHNFTAGVIWGIVILFIAIFIISIGLAATTKFTRDFVVPIMFLRTASVRAAWREFLSILSINKARFFLYLLFHIVINIVIGMLVLALIVCTCCCACCFIAIPYINTVLLLPIHAFRRSYSLYYLQQFGPQFDVFYNEIQNPLPGFTEGPY